MEEYFEDANAHMSFAWDHHYWQSRGYARVGLVGDILAYCSLDDLAGCTPLAERLLCRKQADVLARLSGHRVRSRYSAASEQRSHHLRLLEGHVSLRKASIPQ